MRRQAMYCVSKLHLLRVFVIVFFCLPILSLLPPISAKAMSETPRSSDETSSNVTYSENSPNVISEGMIGGAAKISDSLGAIGESSGAALYTVAYVSYNGLRNTGIFTAKSVQAVGKGIVMASAHTTRAIVKGTVAVTMGTSNIVGNVAKTPTTGSYVRPADSAPTQQIDAQAALIKANDIPIVAQNHQESTSPPNNDAIWPIHGTVTTLFGVPEWPYQPIHTGMDISSGQPSGVTPIRPYKAGRVTEVIHSAYSLGNHVIVDHGNGLKSVYAHMSIISVSVGQEVNTGSILGREGSTGASTGPHLHFEIRQNGQPLNPQQFISGQP